MLSWSRSVLALVLVAPFALVAPACGGGGGSQGGADSAASAKLAPAPDLSIALHVKPASGDAQPFVAGVQSQLKTSMSGAGYKLVEGDKAEVHAKVDISATEETSMFAVQVNGKTRKNYKVQLTASFVGSPDDAVVDTATSEFSSSDGSVDAAAVRKLLVQLSDSGKLTTYASDRKTKIAAAEDDLWKAANVDGCKNAAKKDACDGVQAYIKKYPTGKFTADARQALADADTSIAKKADEEAWKAAAIDECKKPAKSYDCQGVEGYITKFPSGAHVAEGREAMKGSEKARETLATKEKASAKKASFAECEKSCKRAYERAYPGAFEILVNRCIQVECK